MRWRVQLRELQGVVTVLLWGLLARLYTTEYSAGPVLEPQSLSINTHPCCVPAATMPCAPGAGRAFSLGHHILKETSVFSVILGGELGGVGERLSCVLTI